VTTTRLCREVRISRQAYYRGHRHRQRKVIDESAVVELVKRERRLQPRLGVRKLLKLLAPDLAEMGIEIGRDRMFEVLRSQGLLVKRKSRRAPRTTDSRHRFRTHVNLLKEMNLSGAHQAWASDITYVRTREGWVYVSLISDVYTRKIVGYSAHDTLEASGSVSALEQALKQLPSDADVVHHSDRGIQYCCWEYVEKLEERGVRISMTEVDHCYENAQAERLNGILKQEYGLGETLSTRVQAATMLSQAVKLYNTRRPHVSLKYQTPAEVHGEAA
jgi:transposase InsO family protein